MKLLPQKLQSMPYLENLAKFHLELISPRYRNSPKVSCLGMNPGIGWNPDLEESEAENFTHGLSRIYIQPINFLALDPSPISRYSECTKTTSFSILGFF